MLGWEKNRQKKRENSDRSVKKIFLKNSELKHKKGRVREGVRGSNCRVRRPCLFLIIIICLSVVESRWMWWQNTNEHPLKKAIGPKFSLSLTCSRVVKRERIIIKQCFYANEMDRERRGKELQKCLIGIWSNNKKMKQRQRPHFIQVMKERKSTWEKRERKKKKCQRFLKWE